MCITIFKCTYCVIKTYGFSCVKYRSCWHKQICRFTLASNYLSYPMDKQVTPIGNSRQKLPLLLIIILHHDSELRFKLIYRYLSTSKYISYIFSFLLCQWLLTKLLVFVFLKKKKKKASSLPNPFLNRLDEETMTSL